MTPDGTVVQAMLASPMTCPPNAFRTGRALITLEPGASCVGEWGISPMPKHAMSARRVIRAEAVKNTASRFTRVAARRALISI